MRSDRDKKVDAHVGRRVRLRRSLMGMSQTALGQAVGVTFQQIQNYERGSNRIDSGRLFQLAEVLAVPVSFFFDDMPADLAGDAPGLSEVPAETFETENFAKRETLELVRAYYRIPDPAVREGVFELVKAVAGQIAPSNSH